MKKEMTDRYQEIEPEGNRSNEFGAAKSRGSNEIETVVKAVLISAAISTGILTAYDNYIAQKIVALDVKGYIAEQRDLYLNGKINDAELKESFDRLEKVKERVPKNRVIILGDVLVRKNVEELRP